MFMKRIIFLALSCFVLTLGPTACYFDIDSDDDDFGCVNGQGPVVTRNLNLAFFESIDLQLPARVLLRQGNNLNVTVEGYANIIDRLNLNVRNGEWQITTTSGCTRNLGNLTITITMPDLRSVRISGSGDVISDNIFVVNNRVDLSITGSGDLDLGIEAPSVDSRVTGSGDVFLEGRTDFLNHQVSGSGDLRAFPLRAKRVEIQTSGSGDAEVFATENLRVRISGSGDVAYRGLPAIDANITGSGRIINAN